VYDPVESGGTIYGGRVAVPSLATVALVGDSLTDKTYGLSPFPVANGVSGGRLQVIENIGVQSQTVSQVLARIDNQHDASPYSTAGLAGLPPLGFVDLRIGTNDARTGAFGSKAATYDALFVKLLGYAEKVIVRPVPPLGGPVVAANANVPAYNAYLSAKCAASGGALIWLDDCVSMKDGAGAQLAQFFDEDGIHFNDFGTWQAGLDSQAVYESIIAAGNYPDPRSTDSADKYPAQPQWVTNHVNAGTSGTATGGFTGTVPTGWGVSPNGSGMTVVCSIVAADVGDANQTPWLRRTITATGASGNVRTTTTLAGRSVTTIDPSEYETVMELRFNNLNPAYFSGVRSWVQGTPGGALTDTLMCRIGGTDLINETLVMRQKYERLNATAATTNSILYLDLTVKATGSGALGSFDTRCVTIRG
jgi:hypothetical protein